MGAKPKIDPALTRERMIKLGIITPAKSEQLYYTRRCRKCTDYFQVIADGRPDWECSSCDKKRKKT